MNVFKRLRSSNVAKNIMGRLLCYIITWTLFHTKPENNLINSCTLFTILNSTLYLRLFLALSLSKFYDLSALRKETYTT